MRRLVLLPLVVVPVLSLIDVLPAQGVSTTFVAQTQLRVMGGRLRKTVPAKTDLTKGLLLRAGYSLGPDHFFGTTTLTFQHSPTTGTVVTILDSSTARLGVGAHFPVTAQTGSHDTLLVFTATKAVKARLVLVVSSTGAGLLKNYTAIVDIGNNRKNDLSVGLGVKLTKEFTVTIDANGLAVRTQTFSTATAAGGQSASASGILTIRLLPVVDCTASPYGKSCAPVLDGAPTFKNKLELKLTKAAPSTFGILIIGVKPLSIPIPGTTCYLNTDILILLPFTTNNLGEATHTLPIPSGLKLTFNLQDILFQKQGNRFVITSTNGLKVDCK